MLAGRISLAGTFIESTVFNGERPRDLKGG